MMKTLELLPQPDDDNNNNSNNSNNRGEDIQMPSTWTLTPQQASRANEWHLHGQKPHRPHSLAAEVAARGRRRWPPNSAHHQAETKPFHIQGCRIRRVSDSTSRYPSVSFTHKCYQHRTNSTPHHQHPQACSMHTSHQHIFGKRVPPPSFWSSPHAQGWTNI